MEGFTDIEGPLRIGIHPAVWIVIGLLLAAALVALLLRRRPKARQTTAPEGPTPLERALGRLQLLRGEGSQMEVDPFVVGVSDVVREYLEEALQTRAREQTSEEFLHELSDKPDLPSILRETMPEFLSECDLVKFARQSIDADKRSDLLDTAASVIEETDGALRQATVSQGGKDKGGGS